MTNSRRKRSASRRRRKPRQLAKAAVDLDQPKMMGGVIAPTRDQIKPQVIDVLRAVSQKGTPINESDRLDDDLNMTSLLRRAMSLPYSKISATYHGLAVSGADAEALEDVKSSIDLVTKRASGK